MHVIQSAQLQNEATPLRVSSKKLAVCVCGVCVCVCVCVCVHALSCSVVSDSL